MASNDFLEPTAPGHTGLHTVASSAHGAEHATGPHRSSHLGLLSPVARYDEGVFTPRATLSAVVVPTSRSGATVGGGLALAARIAAARDAQLIIIRSGEASRDPFPKEFLPSSSCPTLVLDLPARSDRLLLPWRNDRHLVATMHRRSDLGLKRNIALLLGRKANWDSLLMLDDDISTYRASTPSPQAGQGHADPSLRLDDVLAEFHEYPQVHAAGYLQKDFDDNSVICHIRRFAGRAQEGFVSGGALVVRCNGRPLPFFPATYNEDWLFFFALMLQGHHVLPSSTVRLAGTVHQKAYYPYSAKRAQSEELGDVLAEGLFALIGRPRQDVASAARSGDYWCEVIWQRQNMIVDLLHEHRFRHPQTTPSMLTDVDDSLRAALAIYSGSSERWGTTLAEYVRTLLADLELWNELITRATPSAPAHATDLREALADLGLADCGTWLCGPRRSRTRSARWPADRKCFLTWPFKA